MNLSLPRPSIPALLFSLVALSAGVPAQTTSVTYDLKDVWLRPDITHRWEQARQMTGTFIWTYKPGAFENGTGRFVTLDIPWWGRRTFPKLKVTFDLKAIEFAMIGNFHGLGLDLTLRLAPPLSPYQPSPIDTVNSKFTIEVGVARKGHLTKGSIVPRCNPPTRYGKGTPGSGGLVPAIGGSGGDTRLGNATFRVDVDRIVGGASSFLLLGPRKAQLPVLGFTVLVDPAGLAVVPGRASGVTGAPGAGTLRIPLPIPNEPRLVGADFNAQALALDRGAPGGVAAATSGLNVVICR